MAHARCYAASALAKKLASSDHPRDPNSARDLPTSSANEREVFIQWDGATRSKLSVNITCRHTPNTHRLCVAITYGFATTADAPNVFTLSRSRG